jgi:hypothetical protein
MSVIIDSPVHPIRTILFGYRLEITKSSLERFQSADKEPIYRILAALACRFESNFSQLDVFTHATLPQKKGATLVESVTPQKNHFNQST